MSDITIVSIAGCVCITTYGVLSAFLWAFDDYTTARRLVEAQDELIQAQREYIEALKAKKKDTA